MSCCHSYYAFSESGDTAFSVDAASVTFGHGALGEVGSEARALGCRRVALFTDKIVGKLPHVARALVSLQRAGVDVAVYDEVRIEPSDRSFQAAAAFAKEGRFDGYISVGGGSVMDTCKAALLYATHPADLLAYVNKPVGQGRPVPGPLPPHIACPTTCGTGSECTGIAVCELELDGQHLKAGIAQRALRPTRALIDPACALTLPAAVVASSGFDVLCHALESYTALPYTRRQRPEPGTARPMSQGANPWSDLGSVEALRLCGRYLLRAVRDAGDIEAREQMMYAATLAGIAFGNAGVHVPHGMAYSISGLAKSYRMPGYPETGEAGAVLVPHGVSVILAAPAVFRFTAEACPDRHLAAAAALGVDTSGASAEDAGTILGSHLVTLMQACAIPSGLVDIGYGAADVEPLTAGALLQTRLLSNAPRPVPKEALLGLFSDALRYW